MLSFFEDDEPVLKIMQFMLRYPMYKWAIFMPGKVLNPIYFLKGNNADNSNLILLGLEKQRGIILEA